MHRRAFLSTVGVGAASMAGCLGRVVAEGDSGDGAGDEFDPEATPPGEPVRCRGDPVTVEHAVTDRPGYDDDRGYFPSNGTVRFVRSRGPDGPRSFGTVAFEEWASVEAVDAAQQRVVAATAEHLSTDEFASALADAAPRAADVTASIDGATHTTTVPVFARHTAGGPL